MKNLLLILCLFISFGLQAQQAIYSRVKVKLSPEKTAFQLARLGFDISHGNYAPAKHFIGEFSAAEVTLIKNAGFETETLIEDLKEHFLEQELTEQVETRDDDCDGETVNPYDIYDVPENYTFGSMGGYHTYDEMLAVLDQMVALYPDLISARAPISDILTHENREIFWLRLSDNPNTDETTEPEVLYTAVHHAREPNSLSQMIFFLWYMLENYETDPEVQYLVDNVEMYFIPVVNPDGYVYNETTDPNGGGFWRKNRRNNEDGTYGVDLNRNYGYEWGLNDVGSSPNTDSQVYRGPSAFSEPETQAAKFLCEAHDFKIILNYHTYGNLLIHPWGFDDSATPDDALFKSMCAEMTKQNNFTYGTGVETVGYNVNGDSDDWMYGEQDTKPKSFAMTPEAGPESSGFWPNQNQITPNNKSCMYMNLATANLVLNYGAVTDISDDLLVETDNNLDFRIERLGLLDGGLTVSLLGVSENVTSVGANQSFTLEQNETALSSIEYTLAEDIQPGDEIVLTLGINNGVFTREETLTKIYFEGEAVLTDNGDNLEQWTSPEWGTTNQTYYSAPSSITDSPNGNYSNGELSYITLTDPIDIEAQEIAYLRFWAKWEIESDYDYTQVEMSINGSDYVPLCGQYTNQGVQNQQGAFDEPLYDGLQPNWVFEQIDISDYLFNEMNSIRIRFSLVSDGGLRQDGFYFDNVEILVPETISQTIELGNEKFTYSTRPNPARDYTTIKLSKEVNDADVLIFNILGELVKQEKMNGATHRLDTRNMSAGVYFYELIVEGEKLPSEKFEVIK